MTLRHAYPVPFALFLPLLIAACGQSASAADCTGNVASVGTTTISASQFRTQLQYTLAFYEHGNPHSRYYGVNICQGAATKAVCRSIKKSLVDRMIDQQVVSDYASVHKLNPTSAELNAVLHKEAGVIRTVGGTAAFIAYLHKIGTDQAQFRYLENQEVVTLNVERSMGLSRFRHWLVRQDRSPRIVRCPIK